MNMSYYLAKIFSYICCLLPARFCDWLGNQLGRLTWLVVPQKRKRMARENIQRCLEVDAAEAERIAKASWVRFGPMLLEVLRSQEFRADVEALGGYDLSGSGEILGQGNG